MEHVYRTRLLAVVVCLALALPLAPWAAAQPAKPAAAGEGKDLIAVLDLEAINTDKFQASALTDRLREEMLKSGRFVLVDRAQMDSVLKEQAMQQTGCTSQECAVQVGKILGVRKIVTGRVTKIENELWLLAATVVDVETAETQRAESLQHEGSYRTLLSQGVVTLAGKLAQAAQGAAVRGAAPPPPQAQPAQARQEEPSTRRSYDWKVWTAGGGAVLFTLLTVQKGNDISASNDKQKKLLANLQAQSTVSGYNEALAQLKAEASRAKTLDGERDTFRNVALGLAGLTAWWVYTAPQSPALAFEVQPVDGSGGWRVSLSRRW